MTSFLAPNVDLTGAVATTARAAFAHVPSALNEQARDRLWSRLSDWPLREAPEQVGPVHQGARMALLGAEQWASISDVGSLATELRTAVGGTCWTPNEATVMSYAGRKAGITPHRDHRRFAHLVVIVSLAGEGQLAVLADRAGEQVLADFACRPGDVVLLRGPGLADPADGSDPRPLHAVSGPLSGRRASLTFRMNAEAPV